MFGAIGPFFRTIAAWMRAAFWNMFEFIKFMACFAIAAFLFYAFRFMFTSIGAIMVMLIGILLFMLYKGTHVIKDGEKVFVDRLGRKAYELDAGMHFIVPYIDRPRSILWHREGKVGEVWKFACNELIRVGGTCRSAVTEDGSVVGIEYETMLNIEDAETLVYGCKNPIAAWIDEMNAMFVTGCLKYTDPLALQKGQQALCKDVGKNMQAYLKTQGLRMYTVRIVRFAMSAEMHRDVQACLTQQFRKRHGMNAIPRNAKSDDLVNLNTSECEEEEHGYVHACDRVTMLSQ